MGLQQSRDEIRSWPRSRTTVAAASHLALHAELLEVTGRIEEAKRDGKAQLANIRAVGPRLEWKRRLQADRVEVVDLAKQRHGLLEKVRNNSQGILAEFHRCTRSSIRTATYVAAAYSIRTTHAFREPDVMIDLQLYARDPNYPSQELVRTSTPYLLPTQFTFKRLARYSPFDDEGEEPRSDVYSTPTTRESSRVMTSYAMCAAIVNKRFRDMTIATYANPPPYLTEGPKTTGILQWEVPCQTPAWLEDMTSKYPRDTQYGGDMITWNPEKNPRIKSDGNFVFNTCAVTDGVMDPILRFISRQVVDGEKWWASLFPEVIDIYIERSTDKWLSDQSSNLMWGFLISRCTLALITWGYHARFVYKDPLTSALHLYDPYGEVTHLEEEGYLVMRQVLLRAKIEVYLKTRPADQYGEESCVATALARLLTASRYGPASFVEKLPCLYVLLAFRLVKMFETYNGESIYNSKYKPSSLVVYNSPST